MTLGYEVPREHRHEELIGGVVTIKQAIYLATTLIAAYIIHGIEWTHSLKNPILYCIVGLGFACAFLELDRVIYQHLVFLIMKVKLKRIKDTAVDLLGLDYVHNGIVVKKNGGILSILRVAGVNVSMLSDEELEEVFTSLRGFINSLGFPIQFIVMSESVPVDEYFEKIEQKHSKEDNKRRFKLIKALRHYYAHWVRQKRLKHYKFYVVVPVGSQASMFRRLLKNKGNPDYSELNRRLRLIISELENIGLTCKRLTDDELLCFYKDCFGVK